MFKMKVVFVALLIAMLYPTEGFIPNRLVMLGSKAASFSLKDAITHEDMTRNAHLEVAAEVLWDNPNPGDNLGSSQRLSALSSFDEESLITAYYGYHDHDKIDAFKDAVEAVQNGNSNTDFSRDEKGLAAAHFDSEQFEGGQNRLIALRQSVTSSIRAGNYEDARRDTGRMFHTLQDFYSHSNWIENGNRAPNPVLGQPNQRIANIAGPNQQTCTDCVKKGLLTHYYECQDNIVKSLIQNGILTTGYADGQTDNDGNVIQKPSGKCSHGGFIDPSRKSFAQGGINKDGPYYRTSPHHYLYTEAMTVAQKASADMFRNIRRDVNNDQLFGAYLGVFQNQATIENSIPIGSQAYLRGRIRNILLQHHMDRINELHSQTGHEDEDKERIAAEIAELITKMKRIYQQESRAKRQAETRAKRSAPKQLGPESKDKRAPNSSGTVPTFPLLSVELLMMIGAVVIYYFLY